MRGIARLWRPEIFVEKGEDGFVISAVAGIDGCAGFRLKAMVAILDTKN